MTPLARFSFWPLRRRRPRPRSRSRSFVPEGRIETRPEGRRRVGETTDEHLARQIGVPLGDAAEATRLGVHPRPTYRPPAAPGEERR
jgi:hypothetical protein